MDALAHITELEERGLIDEALTACSRFLLAEESDTSFKADLLRRKAHLLDWYKSQYPECELLLRRELAIRLALHDRDVAQTYFQLGLVLVFMKRDPEAVEFLEAALVASTDQLLLAKAENLLGDILVPRDRPKARVLLESSSIRLKSISNEYNWSRPA